MDSRVERVLTFLVDTIFPPSPEARLVRSLWPDDLRLWYLPYAGHGWTALSPFSSPTIRALIHEAKFAGNERAAELLSVLMHEHIERHPHLSYARFVPVPLSPARLRARGYNQVTRILTALRDTYPTLIIDDTLLARTKNTRPQTELKREERLMNIQNAFRCLYPEQVQGKDIVLIDDVVTTGATLEGARTAFLPYHPHSVTCIALAH